MKSKLPPRPSIRLKVYAFQGLTSNRKNPERTSYYNQSNDVGRSMPLMSKAPPHVCSTAAKRKVFITTTSTGQDSLILPPIKRFPLYPRPLALLVEPSPCGTFGEDLSCESQSSRKFLHRPVGPVLRNATRVPCAVGRRGSSLMRGGESTAVPAITK